MSDVSREAVQYMNRALSTYLWHADWNEASEKDLDKLRSEIRDEDLEKVSEETDIPVRCLQNFIDGGDIGEEPEKEDGDDIEYDPDNTYLQTLVAYAKENLVMGNPLSVEEKTVVVVSLATGGPGFDVNFILNRHGELEGAKAVYRNWGSHEEPLDDDMARELWERYSYIGENIREREEKSHRPGY